MLTKWVLEGFRSLPSCSNKWFSKCVLTAACFAQTGHSPKVWLWMLKVREGNNLCCLLQYLCVAIYYFGVCVCVCACICVSVCVYMWWSCLQNHGKKLTYYIHFELPIFPPLFFLNTRGFSWLLQEQLSCLIIGRYLWMSKGIQNLFNY